MVIILKENIIFVSYTAQMGGGEYSLLYLIKNLDRKIYNPIVIISEEGLLTSKLKEINVEYVIVKQPSFKNKNIIKLLKDYFISSKEIRRLVQKYDCKIVHANAMRSFLYCLSVNNINNVKSIIHIRATLKNNLFRRLLYKIIFKNVDKIIAISDSIKNELLSISSKLDKKIIKIYNGVDTEIFKEETKNVLRTEYNLNSNELIVGIVARLNPWKGHEIFIDAANELIKNNKELSVKFFIIGEDLFNQESSYKEKLINKVKDLDIENKIFFTGQRNDIPQIMKDLDILVCASDNEPFGRVLIEAMIGEAIVISSDCGGPLEIIDEKTGVFFRNKDSNDLYQKLLYVISNKKLQESIRSNALNKVNENFTIEKHVKEIENLYKILINE